MQGFPVQTIYALPDRVLYGPSASAETVLASLLLPAGALEPGGTIRASLAGLITTTTGSPVLDLRLRVGPTTLTGEILGKHSEIAPVADLTWRFFTSNNQDDATVTGFFLGAVNADGLGIRGQGTLASEISTQYQYGAVGTRSPAANDAAIDPTLENLIELTADWDDTAANTFELTAYTLELLAPQPIST